MDAYIRMDAHIRWVENLVCDDNIDGAVDLIEIVFKQEKLKGVELLTFAVECASMDGYLRDAINEHFPMDLQAFFATIPAGERSEWIDRFNEEFGDGEFKYLGH